jgi:transposase
MVKAGKPAKVAIVAIMRKLLILANALIRDRRKWAPLSLDQHGHYREA